MSLITELKRRKVFQVAAVYAVIAWLLVQVVATLEEPLNLPGWLDTTVIVLLGVGFPIALIFAWIFELSPQGIQTTPPASSAAQSDNTGLGKFSLLLQTAILALVVFLIMDQYLLTPTASDHAQTSSYTGVTRFNIEFGDLPSGVGRGLIAIAPQGDRIVYAGMTGLMIRHMRALESQPLLNGRTAITNPSFSPTGEQVAFWDGLSEEILRLALSGGAPVRVANNPARPFGLSWGTDDNIYFGQHDGVYRVPASGNAPPELIIAPGDDLQVFGPQYIGDDRILYSVSPVGAWDEGRILVRSLTSGKDTELIAGGTSAQLTATGHLVYALANNLYGVELDTETLTIKGRPIQLVENVLRANGAWMTGRAHYDVADSGTLIYIDNSFVTPRRLVWVDHDGQEEAIGMTPRAYSHARVSPDGSLLAVDESNLPQNDIWVWDLKRETATRMRLGRNGGDSPAWTSDSKRIAYHPSVTPVIDWQSISGINAPERLVTGYPGALDPWHPSEFTRDGRVLIFQGRQTAALGMDIGMISFDSTAETSWLIDGKSNQWLPDLSPDNRWIAYQSDESGRQEIYVNPFPNVSDERWIISNQGGMEPVWSPDGTELYFLQPGPTPHLMSARIDPSGDRLAVQAMTTVMRWPYVYGQFERSYDISPDGEQFVALQDVQSEHAAPRIIVVQNWFDEVMEKMQASK